MGANGLRRANDPPLLILVSLADGPKHGHALAKDIEDFAGVRLGPGALYGAFTRWWSAVSSSRSAGTTGGARTRSRPRARPRWPRPWRPAADTRAGVTRPGW